MVRSYPKGLIGSRRWPCWLMAAWTIALGSHLAKAAGAEAPVAVELNKLEPAGKSCRAYIVVTNPSDASFPGHEARSDLLPA